MRRFVKATISPAGFSSGSLYLVVYRTVRHQAFFLKKPEVKVSNTSIHSHTTVKYHVVASVQSRVSLYKTSPKTQLLFTERTFPQIFNTNWALFFLFV